MSRENQSRRNGGVGTWVRYFIGTPQRFMRTALVVGLIIVVIKPGLLALACTRLMAEIGPVLGPAIQLAIVIAVLGFMLKSIFKK